MIYPVIRKGKYSYINETGCLLHDFRLRFASGASDGVVQVKTDTCCEFWDTNLERLFKCRTTWEYGRFSSDKCIVHDPRERIKGAVDKTGDVLLSPRYAQMLDFKNSAAPFSRNGWSEWGLVDPAGRILIDRKFDWCLPFSEENGWAAFRQGKLWGFVDGLGRVTVEPEFVHAYSSSEGYAVALSNGISKVTIFDISNGLRSAATWDDMLPFQEGVAAFRDADKWGFVDINGDIHVSPHFDFVHSFSSRRAVVGMGGRFESPNCYCGGAFGAIDHQGRECVRIERGYLAPFEGALACFSSNSDASSSYIGYVNNLGVVIWKAEG